MYEDKTKEIILNSLLSNIPDDYDKNIGYPTYDFNKAFAISEYEIWKALNTLFSMLNVDNLKDNDLTRFTSQRRGIDRKLATNASVILEVKGNGTINAGDLFATKTNVVFKSLETINVVNAASLKAQCIEPGVIGMVQANTIVQFPITLQGISSVNNPLPSYDGFDIESDDSLRQRYYEAVRLPVTSGNKYHYIKWAKEVSGVGAVKVFPLWAGDNTVKVTIVNSDFGIASTDLIDKVQKYIDPGKTGRGEGQAPVGAYCTVDTAKEKLIDVKVKVTPIAGYNINDIKVNLKSKINEYFKSIVFTDLSVSYAKLGSLLFDVQGVADYENFFLNNGTINIGIASDEIPVLSTLEVTNV